MTTVIRVREETHEEVTRIAAFRGRAARAARR